MKTHPLQRWAIRIGVAVIVCSFQLNILSQSAPGLYLTAYGLLFFAFLLVARPTPAFLTGAVFILIAGLAFSAPLKVMGLGVGWFLGLTAVRRYEDEYRRTITAILFIAVLVTLAQFFAVSDAVFTYTYYANDASPIHYSDRLFGTPAFMPQVRPSAIFPSPTYVSAFVVLLYTTIATAADYQSRRTPFVMGMWFALLGSSVGLVLAAWSLLLAWRRRALRWLIAGYVVAMGAYALLMPRQFAYNFDAREVLISFTSRVGFVNVAGESVLQRNLLAVAALLVIGMLAVLLMKRFAGLLLVTPFLVALSLPILVHDLTFSMFYWFLVGAAAARLFKDQIYDWAQRPARRKAATAVVPLTLDGNTT